MTNMTNEISIAGLALGRTFYIFSPGSDESVRAEYAGCWENRFYRKRCYDFTIQSGRNLRVYSLSHGSFIVEDLNIKRTHEGLSDFEAIIYDNK